MKLKQKSNSVVQPKIKVEDIQDILCSEELREKFMMFLRKCLAEESLVFYESVVKYERITEDKQRQDMGKAIVDTFITEDSIYCINISYEKRQYLSTLKVFEIDSFDAAKTAVISLLSSNFYHSFTTSLKDTTPGRKESLASLGSVDEMEKIMGTLNSSKELLALPECTCIQRDDVIICCERRRQIIESSLNKAGVLSIKNWRNSMSKRMVQKLVEEGEQSNNSRKGTKAKRAFKRIFKKKKQKKKRSSFIDVLEI